MASWNILKNAISSLIKTNDNQEITGQVLQSALASIINNLGENAAFAGIATTKTNPGTYDGPVYYIAGEIGTYPNFNKLVVPGGFCLLVNREGQWELEKIDTGILAQIENSYLTGHITVEEMLSINPLDYLFLSPQRSLRLIVLNGINPVGTLDIFTTNTADIVTQVFTTHYSLTEEGDLDLASHSDEELYTYYRTYDLLGHIGEKGTWTKWKSTQPQEASRTQSGLLSPNFYARLANCQDYIELVCGCNTIESNASLQFLGLSVNGNTMSSSINNVITRLTVLPYTGRMVLRLIISDSETDMGTVEHKIAGDLYVINNILYFNGRLLENASPSQVTVIDFVVSIRNQNSIVLVFYKRSHVTYTSAYPLSLPIEDAPEVGHVDDYNSAEII